MSVAKIAAFHDCSATKWGPVNAASTASCVSRIDDVLMWCRIVIFSVVEWNDVSQWRRRWRQSTLLVAITSPPGVNFTNPYWRKCSGTQSLAQSVQPTKLCPILPVHTSKSYAKLFCFMLYPLARRISLNLPTFYMKLWGFKRQLICNSINAALLAHRVECFNIKIGQKFYLCPLVKFVA